MGWFSGVTRWRMGILVTSMLAVGPPAYAQDPITSCRGDRIVCQAVLAGERELASMMVSGDARIVERLFANDAVWSLATGMRWSKSEAVAAIHRAPKMATSRLLKADVRQFGTTAIVVWREAWRATASSREEQAFGTDTWMLRGIRWHIIASQEARASSQAQR